MKKIIVFILLFLFLLIVTFFTIIYFKQNITFLDTPKKLSNTQETISVNHIRWACDCADFIETNQELYLDDGTIDEGKLLFLESDNDSLKTLLSKYTETNGYKFVVKGNFYEDLGISRDYELNTSEKPNKAKVFRFYELEINNSTE